MDVFLSPESLRHVQTSVRIHRYALARAKRRNHFISFISLTSMIGLALGVLAMIVVLSVMNGFQKEMSSRILGMVPHAMLYGAEPVADWRALADKDMANPQVQAAA
ncbi:hypothetical protein ACW4UO_29980, partial [Klebsiella pneumoniae]